jgi:hypothetical protein
MKGNQIAVIAGVVVVAAVVGFLAMRNQPPKGGTEGAIGAANRYTAQQITDADVVLKDAKVQAFLQSDTFHQLATNAEFRSAVVENRSFIEGMRNSVAFDKLAAAMEDLKGRGRFQVSEFAKGAATGENQKGKFSGPLQISEFAAATLANADLAKLPASQLEALFSVENAKLMGNASFVELLKNPAFIEAARSASLSEALKVRGADRFATALTDLAHQFPDALAMLSSDAARNITEDARFASLLDQLSQMPDNAVGKALADKDALAIMADAGFQRIENLTAFTEALKANPVELKSLFSSDVDWGKICREAE